MATSIFDQVGGAATFERIVDEFYARVAVDPVLRPMYPHDLTAARRHLALFLIQYFGGPGSYSEQRGHPRLRWRHVPFKIGPAERDAWLRHMTAAVEAQSLPPATREALLQYFDRTASFLINQ